MYVFSIIIILMLGNKCENLGVILTRLKFWFALAKQVLIRASEAQHKYVKMHLFIYIYF